jgi:hypothetical protein
MRLKRETIAGPNWFGSAAWVEKRAEILCNLAQLPSINFNHANKETGGHGKKQIKSLPMRCLEFSQLSSLLDHRPWSLGASRLHRQKPQLRVNPSYVVDRELSESKLYYKTSVLTWVLTVEWKAAMPVQTGLNRWRSIRLIGSVSNPISGKPQLISANGCQDNGICFYGGEQVWYW